MTAALTLKQRLVIQKNNEAVYQISSGKFPEAIENLTSALNACRQYMGEECQLESERPITSLDQCMTHSEATHFPEDKGRNGSYVYRQGIYIPIEVAQERQSSVMVSTILIFNLALAQQLPEANPVSKQSKLIKAARLYDLAFNMQREEQLGDNIYFALATVNNLGVIYQQLEEKEAANQCFEHLLSTLMLVLDCGESTPQFGRFIHNATSILSKTVSAPAA